MKLQDKLAGWVKTGKGAIIFIHWESKVFGQRINYKASWPWQFGSIRNL